MKSRKIILVAFLVVASVIGLATLQDDIFVESQSVDVSEIPSVIVAETPSEIKTITVGISDGVGSGDNG